MKVGIVSFAHLHAEAYIGNLRNNPAVEYVGFYDPDPERRTTYGTAFDSPNFADWDAFLATGVEAAIVCSENSNHRADVERLAAAGVHVMCEKPLAPTPTDAGAIVDACRTAGVTLMTAFPMRFSMPLQTAKDALDRGDYGTWTSMIGRNQGQCPTRHRAWFTDPALAGGGAMTDHTVHLADIYRWFTGVEVDNVYAVSNHITYRDESDVETGGLVSLTFADGRRASIDCSWSRPLNYPTWGGLALRLVTDRGAVDVDAFRQTRTVYGPPEQHTRWDYWGSDANQRMVDEFVAAVRDHRAPAVTGIDGLRTVEIVDAAYRSVASGKPEPVARR
ncbi:MAG: Gfo/Idh/MocA family oxidoreductase [Spirochaeta sp.]|jgi:predicted dehydrogenase|nr:Gfo/Idh/MocA family oxidoreductase [Spirochaeta sp.]